MTTQEQLAKAEMQFLESVPSVANSLIANICVCHESGENTSTSVAGAENVSVALFRCAKAQRKFLQALRAYAEMLVVEAVSRYDAYEGAFFSRAFFEELEKAIEDDEVISMEEVAAEVGLTW